MAPLGCIGFVSLFLVFPIHRNLTWSTHEIQVTYFDRDYFVNDTGLCITPGAPLGPRGHDRPQDPAPCSNTPLQVTTIARVIRGLGVTLQSMSRLQMVLIPSDGPDQLDILDGRSAVWHGVGQEEGGPCGSSSLR